MSVAEVPVKPKRVRKPRPPKVQVVPDAKPEVVEPKPEVVAPPAEKPVEPAKPKVVRKPRAAKPKVEKPKVEGDLGKTADPGDPLAIISALPAAKVGDLSLDQRHDRYAYLKRAVSASLASFAVIGAALEEIRENEYWKLDRYASWDEFLQSEWDLGGKQRATQLIGAARTYANIKQYLEAKGVEVPLPVIESHVARLQRLDTVEKQANAWQQAWATAERKAGDRLRLTADHIETVVQEYLGFKKLPDTGPNTNKPTPEEKPPAKEPVPQVEEKPEDTVPPEEAAPPVGEEPDSLEGFVPADEEADIIKEGGKVKSLTPTVALQYIIKALKGGYFSHSDPLVTTLVEVVQENLVTWLESPSDVVEVDYNEGLVPDITVEYPEDSVIEDGEEGDEDEEDDDQLDLADGPDEE